MNCGCSHFDEQIPISCIMCNHEDFVEDPDEYYKMLGLKECKDDKEET